MAAIYRKVHSFATPFIIISIIAISCLATKCDLILTLHEFMRGKGGEGVTEVPADSSKEVIIVISDVSAHVPEQTKKTTRILSKSSKIILKGVRNEHVKQGFKDFPINLF